MHSLFFIDIFISRNNFPCLFHPFDIYFYYHQQILFVLNIISVIISNSSLFRTNPENTSCFLGMAYLPNKILKTFLKMQAFYVCFIKFCLALNSYSNSYFLLVHLEFRS